MEDQLWKTRWGMIDSASISDGSPLWAAGMCSPAHVPVQVKEILQKSFYLFVYWYFLEFKLKKGTLWYTLCILQVKSSYFLLKFDDCGL